MSPNGVTDLLPEQFPRVVIAGVSYSVKWSHGAIYRLDKRGVDIGTVAQALRDRKLGFALTYDLLAVCIERNPRFQAEELCDLVTSGQHAELVEALLEAMGKAQPSAEVKLRESTASESNPSTTTGLN